MLEKLEKVETRYEEVQLRLCDPEIVTDQAQYKKLMQEAKRLAPIVEKYRQFKAARDTFQEAKALLDAGGLDKEFHDMVFEELEQARAEMERTQEELKVLLLPRDPNDEKNVIVEIRGGAGGQHVNKTESAIRITHLPTGTVVECQDERSQYKNKDRAMKILRSRILEAEREKQHEAIAGERRAQVGTGDRSERIRTYNFPQGRVSDHRIGLTLYKIEQIMNGALDEVIDALITADTAEKLKAESDA